MINMAKMLTAWVTLMWLFGTANANVVCFQSDGTAVAISRYTQCVPADAKSDLSAIDQLYECKQECETRIKELQDEIKYLKAPLEKLLDLFRDMAHTMQMEHVKQALNNAGIPFQPRTTLEKLLTLLRAAPGVTVDGEPEPTTCKR